MEIDYIFPTKIFSSKKINPRENFKKSGNGRKVCLVKKRSRLIKALLFPSIFLFSSKEWHNKNWPKRETLFTLQVFIRPNKLS